MPSSFLQKTSALRTIKRPFPSTPHFVSDIETNKTRLLWYYTREFSAYIKITENTGDGVLTWKGVQGVAISLEKIRGIEGNAASWYFSVFDVLILRSKESFFFKDRNRRPPLDNVNALLSFSYTLLANMASAALSASGLDPYVGFLHRDRPGRISLALDLMEELRPIMADRFVLALINRQMVTPSDFVKKENGAVILTEEGRKRVITAWQDKKQEKIKHPFLEEKIEWGLVPYAQAMLLARFLRGDMDGYPPFMWKQVIKCWC